VPFEKVLFALGIKSIGETVAKDLAITFKSIEAMIINSSINTLIKIKNKLTEYFPEPDLLPKSLKDIDIRRDIINANKMSDTLVIFDRLFDSIELLKGFSLKANLPYNIKKKNDILVLRKNAKEFIKNNVEQAFIQYSNFEGIGLSILTNLVTFFELNENIEMIQRLQNIGLNFETEEQNENISDLLKGESIVISGTFIHHSREEYKTIIEANGGKNVSSISSKTTFVLAGEGMGPKKFEKANELGIEILTEEEFLKKFNLR
jgi:NAD-dependent DNA ligase